MNHPENLLSDLISCYRQLVRTTPYMAATLTSRRSLAVYLATFPRALADPRAAPSEEPTKVHCMHTRHCRAAVLSQFRRREHRCVVSTRRRLVPSRPRGRYCSPRRMAHGHRTENLKRGRHATKCARRPGAHGLLGARSLNRLTPRHRLIVKRS